MTNEPSQKHSRNEKEMEAVGAALESLSAKIDNSPKSLIESFAPLIRDCLSKGRTALEIYGVFRNLIDGFVIGYPTFTYHLRQQGFNDSRPGKGGRKSSPMAQRTIASRVAAKQTKRGGGIPAPGGPNYFEVNDPNAGV